ncbi:MAG: phage tail protein [Actinomycetota bacterium]
MTDILLTTFNFEVYFDRETGDGPQELGDGGFQEVSGLEVEMDVSDLEEGGRNDGVIRRIGRARFQPLVCKRGMLGPSDGEVDNELWQWFQDIVAGVRPVRRYNGTVLVNNQADEPMAVWRFVNAVPAKIVGPQLNATTGAIAIEELHLAHEGLHLEGTT